MFIKLMSVPVILMGWAKAVSTILYPANTAMPVV